MTCYDFHSHSTASDGDLTPSQLVQRAQQMGVDVLALTDHDTTFGLNEAQLTANALNLKLLKGIELSVTWYQHYLHILGLGIEPNTPQLIEGIAKIQQIRGERARKIAHLLEKKRIFGAFEAIQKIVGDTGMMTRSHFAQFLLAENYVATEQDAFDKYLGQGKPAHVSTHWAELQEAVAWIIEAGGVAVLAHPLRYHLSGQWMTRLLTEFKACGGLGIEVVTGRCVPQEIEQCATLAIKAELAASVGSDFHSPKNPWVELGRLTQLPQKVKPVWELAQLQSAL